MQIVPIASASAIIHGLYSCPPALFPLTHQGLGSALPAASCPCFQSLATTAVVPLLVIGYVY
ncbi:hypothetical protein BCR44DRAFT_1427790 [Catenaria anguillulae PL171]|uniref:Uncharacterized protein n=1 Tax=Catenaria anguillulae PL171 TaxID=765915 RepID=A0A1Y2HVY8_9FUNG|nr:hypothetical protein BCR44DRAFT_1427790 [Catenaria anguillulae PL171]